MLVFRKICRRTKSTTPKLSIIRDPYSTFFMTSLLQIIPKLPVGRDLFRTLWKKRSMMELLAKIVRDHSFRTN